MNDDAELYLRWLRAKDEAAFDALARRHADLVADVAWRVSRDASRAEDALQEALFALAHDGTERPATVGVRAWLARAAISRAKNRRASDRARGRRERGVARGEGAVTQGRSEDAVRVGEALSHVDGEDAALLTLRYLHGVDYGEIAAIFDVAEATARVRVHRALERVRKAAGREELGEGAAGAAIAALPRFALDPRSVTHAIRAAVAGAGSVAAATGVGVGLAAGARATSRRLVPLFVAAAVAGVVWFARPWHEAPAPGVPRPSMAELPRAEPAGTGLAANPAATPAARASGTGESPGPRSQAEGMPTKGPSPASSAPPMPRPSPEVRASPPKIPVTLRMELVNASGVVEELEISEIYYKGGSWPGSVIRGGRPFEVWPNTTITIRTADPRALVPGLWLKIPSEVPSALVGRVPARDDPRLASLTLEIVDAKTGRPIPGAILEQEEEGRPRRVADAGGRITISHDPEDPRSPTVPLVDWWYEAAWSVRAPGYGFESHSVGVWDMSRRTSGREMGVTEMGRKELRLAFESGELRSWLDRGVLDVRLWPLGEGWGERELRLTDVEGRPLSDVLVVASLAWPSALGAAATPHDVCLGGVRRTDARGLVAIPTHRELTVIGLDVFRGGVPIAAFLLHVDGWPESGPREVRLPALADVEIVLEEAPAGVELSYFADELGAARTPQDGPAFPVTADPAARRHLEEKHLVSMAGQVEVHGFLGPTERTIRFPMPLGTKKDVHVWGASEGRWIAVEATGPGPLRLIRRWSDLPREGPVPRRTDPPKGEPPGAK